MPHPVEPVSVRHPELGVMVLLNPAVDYDADDVLVKAYRWAFVPKRAVEPRDSVSVEVATAVPGEKRSRWA